MKARLTTLMTHASQPIAEDDDFFVSAPAEIGNLLSASTTLKKNSLPQPLWLQVLVGVLVCVASYCVIAGILSASSNIPFQLNLNGVIFILILPGVVSLVLGGIGYWKMQFSHSCTYVGTKGLAWYQCFGRRNNLTRREIFLFENAAELRFGQTAYLGNGGYAGTVYVATWSSNTGKHIYKLSGHYKAPVNSPINTHPFWFAVAADRAWTNYLIENQQMPLDRDKLLTFSLTPGKCVEINGELLVLKLGAKRIDLKPRDIEHVAVQNGKVVIAEIGGTRSWLSNKGIHEFKYENLANGQVFLCMLERRLGIRPFR